VTRQIVIGGKNKYMINGHTVQQTQISNLFHSVQLNVNNPHFLIMQGRVTKVLNMKPPEILSMIEEAAGTRMFETKKQASLKTLEKKQAKVDEITKCLENEITPTLESLRNERLDYHKYQKNAMEYERLHRFIIAFEYYDHEKKLLTNESYHVELKDEMLSLEETIIEKNTEIKTISLEINEIIKKRDNEMENEIMKLKKEETVLSKDVVKVNTFLSNHNEQVNNEEEVNKSIVKSMISNEKTHFLKSKQLEQLNVEILEKEKNTKEMEEKSTKMKNQYSDYFAGKTDENTTELLSQNEQILTWEKHERETLSKLSTNEQNYSFHQKKLIDFNKKHPVNTSSTSSSSSSYNEIMKENEKLSFLISDKLKSLKEFSSIESKQIDLSLQLSTLSSSVSSSSSQYDQLSASLSARLAFDYISPEKNFDRSSRVYGMIAELFTMKAKNLSIALEVIAGGKLHQIVVDNERTAALLIEKGKLKKRTTFLPLSKLSSHVISVDKLRKAKELAKSLEGINGNAFSPLEMISYDNKVAKAMEFVFGNVIICSSSNIAKTIAFHRDLQVKTVTLEGDFYDPSGIVTGGSSTSLGSLLSKIADFQEMKETMASQQSQITSLKAQLKEVETKMKIASSLSNEIEILKHSLSMNENKLSESDFAQILLQRQTIEKEILLIQQVCLSALFASFFSPSLSLSLSFFLFFFVVFQEKEQLQEFLMKTKAELVKLSKIEKNANKAKEQKLKEFENQMKQSQNEFNSLKSQLISLKSKKEGVCTEIASVEKEIDLLKEQKQISDSTLAKFYQDKKDLEEKVSNFHLSFPFLPFFVLSFLLSFFLSF
jgi:structural maintenance of chromosome 2